MDAMIAHISSNKFFYSITITVFGFAALYWLSRYFVTKKEFEDHVKFIESQQTEFIDTQKKDLFRYRSDFSAHKEEHAALRDTVLELKHSFSNLPQAKEMMQMREEMANLRGNLEGLEPLLKQILKTQDMLMENELRGETK